jgi:YidC/Oxa1 family membrane protein insertase
VNPSEILQPIENILTSLLEWLHASVGLPWAWTIIVLTLIVRIVILPLTIKQIRSMNALRVLQPQMKEIQEKYKNDRQRMQQEMMKFYKENKVNPFSSCLPLLLQLPVFLALFNLLRSDQFADRLTPGSEGWLFIDNLAEKATGAELAILMILYVGSQVGASLVMSVTMDKTQQRIMLLLPLAFAVIIPSFPAGLIVYWITTNFWTLGQQIVVRRLLPPPQPGVPATAAAAVAGGGTANPGTAPAKKPPPPPRKKKRRRR